VTPIKYRDEIRCGDRGVSGMTGIFVAACPVTGHRATMGNYLRLPEHCHFGVDNPANTADDPSDYD
jgi:hypothetical protein